MRTVPAKPLITLVVAAATAFAVATGGSGRSSAAKHVPAGPPKELAFAGANADHTKGFEFGFEVRLTGDGPDPRQLLSTALKDVSFRNTTDGPVTVVFDNFTVPAGEGELTDSGVIAPGGTFSFKPSYVGSFHYHLGSNPDVYGNIQADPENPYDQPGN